MKKYYGEKRDLTKLGHSLVVVEDVGWSIWPGKSASKKLGLTRLTCTKCSIVARGSLKTKVPCHGTEATCCSKQRVLWNNIKDTSNGMALLRAWGVSQTDVEEWMFGVAVAPSVPGCDAKGHDWHLVEVEGKRLVKNVPSNCGLVLCVACSTPLFVIWGLVAGQYLVACDLGRWPCSSRCCQRFFLVQSRLGLETSESL